MPTEMTIRLAGPEDIDQIRDLTMRAYAKWLPITPRKPLPMTADYDLSVQQNRFDFLYCGDQLVGLIETVRQDEALMIVNVAIDPAQQGRGYGTLLMKHAEQLARNSALAATRLYTNKLMTENIALYTRLGYRVERETLRDPGTVVVHMMRPIS